MSKIFKTYKDGSDMQITPTSKGKNKKNKKKYQKEKQDFSKVLLRIGTVFGKYLLTDVVLPMIFAYRSKVSESKVIFAYDRDKLAHDKRMKRYRSEFHEEMKSHLMNDEYPVIRLTTDITAATSSVVSAFDTVVNPSWNSFLHQSEFAQLFDRVMVCGKMTLHWYPTKTANVANTGGNENYPSAWLVCDKAGNTTPFTQMSDALDYADKKIFDLCRAERPEQFYTVPVDTLPDTQWRDASTNFTLPYAFKFIGLPITGVAASTSYGYYRVSCDFALQGEIASDA